MRTLVWFRADLRCQDNPALFYATQQATRGVLGLFVICPQPWKEHDWGDRRVAWLRRNLEALSSSLLRYNIPLLIRTSQSFADIPVILSDVVHRYECDAVFFNKEYEINERRRDQATTQWLETVGCRVFSFDDQVIVAPGRVHKADGDMYTVFTPFKKAWFKTLAGHAGQDPLPCPKTQHMLVVGQDKIPGMIDGFDLSKDREDLWQAGEEAAHQRLQHFVTNRLATYHEQRDIPAIPGTSVLSPYLTVGVLSARQCFHAATEGSQSSWLEGVAGQNGVATWISELIWREFYRHLLVAFPKLCMYQPFQSKTRGLCWREHEPDFQAWCAGNTGFPIVDAAMTQLNETGWMHNRLRMIVAMFLTKDLLIDWRKGERYFMQHLVDGDLASNNGGWQWSASTGTDAAPYFRIFNPWSQSKRYDPEGIFIKSILPTLAEVPATALHAPALFASYRPKDYPAPICEHNEARQRAIQAFRSLPEV